MHLRGATSPKILDGNVRGLRATPTEKLLTTPFRITQNVGAALFIVLISVDSFRKGTITRSRRCFRNGLHFAQQSQNRKVNQIPIYEKGKKMWFEVSN